MIKRATASDLFSVRSFQKEAGLFFFKDESLAYLGFGFICNPLTYLDDSSAQKLNVLFSQNYPNDSIVQVMLWASPDIEQILCDTLIMRDWINQTDADSPEQLLKTIFEKKAEHFDKSVNRPIESRNKTKVRDLKVIITVRFPCKAMQPGKAEEEDATELKHSVFQVLETTGMCPQSIAPESYLRIMHTLINWGTEPAWKKSHNLYDEGKPLCDQIVDINSVINSDAKGVWLGEKRVKTLSVKRYPEHIHLVNALCYLGDPRSGARGLKGNTLITLNVLYPAADDARAKAEGARNRVTYQATGPMTKYVPKLISQKQSYDELFKAVDDGDRIVKANMTVCLFADGPQLENGQESADATAAVSNAITYFRELGFQLQEDVFINLPLFLNSLPFGAEQHVVKDLMRYKTMATRHATHLMPVGGEWKGTGTPVISLVGRNGQLMSIDLFDSSTNYSAIIAAESGSGKSFYCSDIITSYRSIGARIWCIDAGRSYEKTAKSLHGDFIEFTADSEICLNPFEIIHDYDEQADTLLAVLVAMIAPNDRLTDFQIAVLRSVVKDLWNEHGRYLSIDKLAEALKNFRDFQENIDSRIKNYWEKAGPQLVLSQFVDVLKADDSQKIYHNIVSLWQEVSPQLTLGQFAELIRQGGDGEMYQSLQSLRGELGPHMLLEEFSDRIKQADVADLDYRLTTLMEECGADFSFDEFQSVLKSYRAKTPDRRITDLGAQLYPFTSRGEYGKYFNGKNTVSFQNPLTVLELDELKGRPHLQQVVLVQLISQIHSAMYLGGDYDTPKCVIVDEAWDLLTKGSVAEFMVGGFRRFRKYRGAAIILTQSVNDLYKTPGGEAIAENAANKFLLGQTSEAIDQLQESKRLSLGEGGYDILKTLHKVDGAYSEVFCYTKNGAGIGRLIVDRFTQLMYTTQPNERKVIMDNVERGMSFEDAIIDIIDREERSKRQRLVGS